MLIAFPIVTLAVVFCNYYLDTRIASSVQLFFRSNKKAAFYLANIPDVLLIFVVIVTLFALYLYFSRSRKGLNDQRTLLYKLVAVVAPASYVLKSVAKFIFGRIQTREWLLRPDLYGFNWFHGGGNFEGFPSGHMVVFTALAAALWRFYPECRTISRIAIVVLGFSLIATNYHFLGDVIAGAYLGLVIEMVSCKVIATAGLSAGQ